MKGKFHILLFTNRDSDNLGDKVIEACDIALIHAVMENLGKQDYVIESFDAEDIFKADMENRIKDTDLILVGGAPMFNYVYQNFYERTIITLEYAQKYGKPVVFSAVGIDAYDASDERCMRLKKALNMDCVKMITTRDGYDFLKQYREREDLLIGKVADPAVLCAKIFEMYLLPKPERQKKKIGIFVLRGNGFADNKVDFSREEAIELWQNLAALLEERMYDYEFLTSGHVGDEAFLQLLVQKYGIREENCVFNMDTPELLIQKIASYDGVISCRLHPGIVSYALEVPSVGLVWNYKVPAFYQSIGYADRAIDSSCMNAYTILDTLENAMQEGVSWNKEYAMSVYNSLYHGILAGYPSEECQEPFEYPQLMNHLSPYSGTPKDEQRRNEERKLRNIYKIYNALFARNVNNQNMAKVWKKAYEGYDIIYNGGVKDPRLSWAGDAKLGEINQLETGSVEYNLYARGHNDGNTILLKNIFLYPHHEFVGWRMRIKCSNQWYWYIEDDTLMPKEQYDQSKNVRKKIFAEWDVIPIISKDYVQTVVLEAAWKECRTFHILYNSGAKSDDIRWEYSDCDGVAQRLASGSCELYASELSINERHQVPGHLKRNQFIYPNHIFLGWKMRIRSGEEWYWYANDGSVVLQEKNLEETISEKKSSEENYEVSPMIFTDEAAIPYLPISKIDAVVVDAVWQAKLSYRILYNSGSTDTKHIKCFYKQEEGETKTLPSGSMEFTEDIRIINGELHHFKKNKFVRKGYEFAGWRLRVKTKEEWFWFLSDGSLCRKDTFQDGQGAAIQTFIDEGIVPYLPAKHIEVAVVEAIWREKDRRGFIARRASGDC